MNLKGVKFNLVWNASGAKGFFGEGYWFHRIAKSSGLNFGNTTFVAKTTTLNPRTGNMLLKEDFSPKELFPRCIIVKPLKGVALNSVGLSGPGALKLFETGLWQKSMEPFFISFMSVAEDAQIRIKELQQFIAIFKHYLPSFHAPVGLQINYSCPNVGINPEKLFSEAADGLNTASCLDIPLIPKFNVLFPIDFAVEFSKHRACDAICVSNTIPWGQLPEFIDWEGLFGTKESPLAHLGGGGLSGKPLLPLLVDWVKRARKAGLKKPINAGGGILSKKDARMVLDAGADSIFLGSIAFLRPWRIRGIISSVNN